MRLVPIWAGNPAHSGGISGMSVARADPAAMVNRPSKARVFWRVRRADREKAPPTTTPGCKDGGDRYTAPHWARVPPPGPNTEPSRDVTGDAPPTNRG